MRTTPRRADPGAPALAAPPAALGALVLAALLAALSSLSAAPWRAGPADIAQAVHGLSAHAAAAHARAPAAHAVEHAVEGARALPGAPSVSTRGGRGEPVAERGGADGQVGRARPASRLQPGRDDRRHDRLDPVHAPCAGSPACPAPSLLPAPPPPPCSPRHAAARLRRSRDAALHRRPRGPPAIRIDQASSSARAS